MNTNESLMEVSEIAMETISEDEASIPEFLERWRRQEIWHRRRIYELEREKEIDANIKKMAKRFLKRNKQFRRVKTRNEATAILMFLRSDLSTFWVVLKDKDNNDLIDNPEGSVTRIYLKHSNPHDRTNTTRGLIDRQMVSVKKNYS